MLESDELKYTTRVKLTLLKMIPRWIRRRGWTNIHLFGCALVILVCYKVLYSTDLNSDDSSSSSGKIDKRDSSSGNEHSKKKAAYRYERYNNRNKQNLDSPGELGAAVNLVGKDASLADSLFKKEAFNIIASNRIALNRTLKDIRDPK